MLRLNLFYIYEIDKMIDYLILHDYNDIILEAELMDLRWKLRKGKLNQFNIHQLIKLRESFTERIK